MTIGPEKNPSLMSRTFHFTRSEEASHYIGIFVFAPYSFRALVGLSLGNTMEGHLSLNCLTPGVPKGRPPFRRL